MNGKLVRILLLTMILVSACTPANLNSPAMSSEPSQALPNEATALPMEPMMGSDPIGEDPAMTQSPPASGNDELQNLGPVQIAIDDLAQRLGEAKTEITVISVDEVTWRDGSLGCPQPGMVYTQALVDGMLIVLQANGLYYSYHSGRGGAPFLCEQASGGKDVPIAPGGIDATVPPPRFGQD